MHSNVMDLSIVIPVYNEVDSLQLLHQALHAALKEQKRSWEVIYVDDGSRDGSMKLLEEMAAQDPKHIVVVEFRRNFGQTTAIAALPSIAAWRRAFTRFGAKPTQYRNAAESLQRRLEKQGEIPSISTLVDLGNLVSIRYALPVAIFDRAKFADAITVRIANGTEPFADLGSSESVHPEPGEVIFVDGDGIVCARRWCWRQSADSAVSPDTTGAMIVIEGHHETAEADIRSAVADMKALLEMYQPGSVVDSFEVPR